MTIAEKIKKLATKLAKLATKKVNFITKAQAPGTTTKELKSPQEQEVVELGEKPEVIRDEETKEKEDVKRETDEPSIVVKGNEPTETDNAAFQYFVELLKQGKGEAEALKQTQDAFYKKENLFTRFAKDLKKTQEECKSKDEFRNLASAIKDL